MIATLHFDIAPQTRYRVTLRLHVEGRMRRLPPALLTCQFTDADGAKLDHVPEGFTLSPTYGAHVHVGQSNDPAQDSRDADVSQILIPPPQAAHATLTLHRWRARDVSLIAPMQVAPIDDAGHQPALRTDAPADPDRLMWAHTGPTTPGEVYELTAQLAMPLAERDIVATVHFTTADGAETAPMGRIAKSEQVGFFHYLAPLSPSDPSFGFAKFHAPPDAAQIDVRLLRWAKVTANRLDHAILRPRSDRPDLLASGDMLCPPITDQSPLAFRTDLAVTGPEPVLVDLTFLDEAKQVLPTTAQDLQQTLQFDAFARLTPDPLSRHDGVFPLHIPITPPESTHSINWCIFLPEGGGHSQTGQPNLVPCTVSTQAAPAQDLHTDLLHAMGQTAARTHMARHGFDQLASLATKLNPSATWHTLALDLTRDAGGLAQAEIILSATYFDADKTPLSTTPAGFATRGDLGLHRRLVIAPRDAQGCAAQIITPLLTPEGAAYALYDVIVCRPDSGIQAAPLTHIAVDAQTACRALDAALMNKPQLIQSLEIAEAADDLAARHAILSALAAVDPQTKGYAYRARVLAEDIEVQTPGWLPDPGPVSHVSPDTKTVFHLADTGGATLCKLMKQQTGNGLRPVLGTGFQSLGLDGLTSGLVTAPLAFPLSGIGQLSIADRLSIEARQHSKTIAAHRAALLHMTTDFASADTALVALSLARAHALPLVLELVNLTRCAADDARVARCLAAADHIIVTSHADRAAPCLADIAPDRISLIEPALDAAFETPAPRAARKALDDLLPAHLTRALGYHAPAEADPLATLSPLIDLTGAKPTVILLGNADPALHLRLRAAGLTTLSPDDPAPQTDNRAWYKLCDTLILDPKTAPAIMIDTALKSLSQGVAPVLPDSPDARHFAGDDGARAQLYDPQTPETLRQAVQAATALAPSQRANNQRWLRDTHLWGHRLSAVARAYAAARAAQHAKGGS